MGKQIKHLDLRLPDSARTNRLRIIRLLAGNVSTLGAGTNPLSVCVNAAGTLAYFGDNGNPTVRSINLATGEIRAVTATAVASPVGIALSAAEDALYVASDKNHAVYRVALSDGQVTTLCGTPGTVGMADGTPGTLNNPASLVRVGGTLYIGGDGGKIRTCNLGSGAVGTVVGVTTSGGITALTTANGSLWAADTAGYLYRVPLEGSVTEVIGAGGAGDADGDRSVWRFGEPRGMTADDTGTMLYFADRANSKIRRLDTRNGTMTTVAGSGTAGEVDGLGAAATFNNPYGVAWIPGGRLIVAGGFGSAVRVIS